MYETDQQWSVAEVIAKDYFGANHAEAEKFVISCYVDVFSGYGVSQILEDMGIYEAELPLVQFCGLWQLLQWEVMNTASNAEWVFKDRIPGADRKKCIFFGCI